jgi:hypothetical protein
MHQQLLRIKDYYRKYCKINENEKKGLDKEHYRKTIFHIHSQNKDRKKKKTY